SIERYVDEFAGRHLTVAAADSVIGRDELCQCCRGGRLMLTPLIEKSNAEGLVGSGAGAARSGGSNAGLGDGTGAGRVDGATSGDTGAV
ncbi:MAG TPA: hypothetical protein VEY69_00710, partial [Lautropia sp.]|nr:hypothetical protein [Lautropia sp.]